MADFTDHEQYPAEGWCEKSRGDVGLGEQASMIPNIFCSKWNPFGKPKVKAASRAVRELTLGAANAALEV